MVMFRRFMAITVAGIIALSGASLIWSAIWFAWELRFRMMDAAVVPTDQEFVPVPIIGFIALYYLIGFGFVQAISIMVALGVAALVLAYAIVRRVRKRGSQSMR
jgi:hypothetical protein